MTEKKQDNDKRNTYAPCIYNHALLGVVASPHLVTVATATRVFLDVMLGLEPIANVDLRTLPIQMDEMHDLISWLDDYVHANEDHLDPGTDTWIGAHSLVGRLFDGMITLGIEEWPFEGQYAASFFLKKDEDANQDFQRRAMLKGMVFHAALNEMPCIEQPRDFLAFGPEMDKAFENFTHKRDAITGKPRLVVIPSNKGA